MTIDEVIEHARKRAEEFENGYNKAIDDFIKACDKKCGFYSGINKQLTRDMLLELAEQLKH